MVKVKICGITNLDDAIKACEYGADLLGFVFVKDTLRYIGKDKARDIVLRLPEEYKNKVDRVGLFMNEDIERVAEITSFCDLNFIQLHGQEDVDYCRDLRKRLAGYKILKAIKVKDEFSLEAISEYDAIDFFLFDSFAENVPGGTGKRFKWDILEGCDFNKPFFLAGGLTPENIADAIRMVKPYGVDVSSGVEKEPGIKDEIKVKEFIANAKSAG
ncbi:MAG: phosphoribosylanthranilate isomerase [Candidatus Omnitrophota bacterium]|nr:MAG: phosphoribosylanthranilate isomerase [Candidatus Omnitrophota bacterium]